MTEHASRHDTSRAFTVRLRFATIKTGDLNTSLGFYERILGFPRTRTAADFVQLDAGGAELCVNLHDGGEHQPRLIFAVDGFDALCAHFQRTGVPIIAGGPQQPWVMVRDPDENEVVFEK
jgi:catechol 2,3-dioxygenase-like lactoylglutathione lyase family enzyme